MAALETNKSETQDIQKRMDGAFKELNRNQLALNNL